MFFSICLPFSGIGINGWCGHDEVDERWGELGELRPSWLSFESSVHSVMIVDAISIGIIVLYNHGGL